MDRQTDRQTGAVWQPPAGSSAQHSSPAIPAVHWEYHLRIQLPPNMQGKVALPSVSGSFSHHSTFLHVPGGFFLDPALPSSAHIPETCRQPPVPGRGAGRVLCQAWPCRMGGSRALGMPLAARIPHGHSSAPHPLLGQPQNLQLHLPQKDSLGWGFYSHGQLPCCLLAAGSWGLQESHSGPHRPQVCLEYSPPHGAWRG